MRDDLRALTPDDLRAWLQHQRDLLTPHVTGTRPGGWDAEQATALRRSLELERDPSIPEDDDDDHDDDEED